MPALPSSLQALRLPGFGRLLAPRCHRRLSLPSLRCSSSSNGDGQGPEGLDDSEDRGNMLRSFSSEQTPSGSSPFKGFGQPPLPKGKPSATEALISSLGGVSDAKGRESKTNNIILGNDQTEESWRELDGQVNEYPGNRTFKAIGSGGEDFVAAMRGCAERVVGPLHEECVSTRASAKGNYTSVTLSVWVETPDQVLSIYNFMKEDPRLKFFF